MKTVDLSYHTHCPSLRMTRGVMRSILLIIMFATAFTNADAANSVQSAIAVKSKNEGKTLTASVYHIGNENDVTSVGYRIISHDMPFEIYRVDLRMGKETYQTLEPFTLSVDSASISGRSMQWDIINEFPMLTTFYGDGVIILHTDKGIIELPTSSMLRLQQKLLDNQKEYEITVKSLKDESTKAWTYLIIVVIIVAIIGMAVWLGVRRHLIKTRHEMDEMAMLMSERSAQNEELRNKVERLYGERLDTLNMLCNEYFEKNESENVRLSLYNEVEKQILSLRDRKSVENLEKAVNAYLDNIMSRLREQLPELSNADYTFLIYLYAGFSPRAVCIFTGIKVKNFYNKRARLKERILASDAPDREFFVSKMSS